MSNIRVYFFILSVFFIFSCKKEVFSTDENAVLFTSLTTGDSLKFDTVFAGSTTPVKIFKIFNHNKESVLINNIQLNGGENSPYKVNINGTTAASFNNVQLAAGDSLYVFVNLSIPLSQQVLPFDVTDSLEIFFNHKKKNIVLNAVGQNAVYINETTYAADVVWKSELPIIVKGNITVANNATLTIEAGTTVYFNPNTGLIINGELHASGYKFNQIGRIVFTNFRKDDDYKYLPGSWNGVVFGKNAAYSKMEYVTIENAKTAVADTMRTQLSNSDNLVLNGCIIQNCINGLRFKTSNVLVGNTLVANCSNAFSVNSGGIYRFYFSTIAGYGNRFVPHNAPLIQISDADVSGTNLQKLNFFLDNSIVFGSLNDELDIKLNGADNHLSIRNSIYKSSALHSKVIVENSLQNANPAFLILDDRNMLYSFKVAENSPAKAFGKQNLNTFTTDIEGKQRSLTAPTIGCYE